MPITSTDMQKVRSESYFTDLLIKFYLERKEGRRDEENHYVRNGIRDNACISWRMLCRL
jgi:hypothetical protein